MQPPADAPRIKADVVGPVCETGDYLASTATCRMLKPGDLIAVCTAGAYGAVQAGTYNYAAAGAGSAGQGRPFPVVRPRRTYEELIGLDSLPDWLD